MFPSGMDGENRIVLFDNRRGHLCRQVPNQFKMELQKPRVWIQVRDHLTLLLLFLLLFDYMLYGTLNFVLRDGSDEVTSPSEAWFEGRMCRRALQPTEYPPCMLQKAHICDGAATCQEGL